VQDLEKRGLLNVTDVRGQWETFRTTVVTDYQKGKDALVIAGSDKRAVVYGIYTLAEQCGQSP
jgi:alpha-glucuronidase